MMKKIILMFACAAMLLSLCACENTNDKEDEVVDTRSSFEIAEEFMDSTEIETYMPDNGYQDPAEEGEAGEIVDITYYSETVKKDRPAKVQLPVGYDEDKEYPVLYVLHGIFGDQTTMINSWQTNDIVDHMIAEGLAEEMIVVYPYMYASETEDTCPGITVESAANYDNFLNDLVNDLMPYMAENFSIAEGKDNTAVFGFSMGGREALAIGFTYPDMFGYIAAACPAPGLVPGQDWAMQHPGQFQNDELKFTDEMPYLVLIGAGDSDGTVGTFPESYHNLMEENGVKHLWYIIPGSDHGDPAIASVTYNFLKYVFKAK